jgi:O-acetyl-ADP-ribose deacetylase
MNSPPEITVGLRRLSLRPRRRTLFYGGEFIRWYNKRLKTFRIKLAAKNVRCEYSMKIEIVCGDLLDQNVDVIVNAWNRNIIPWWLLLPQGVSGAIKKRGGLQPFKEVAKHGPIPLGDAVLTGAGTLPFKGIIHVAGINMLWRASEYSIRRSVQSAMQIVNEKKFDSVAFPILGAGSGGFNVEKALQIMEDEFSKIQSTARVTVVKFQK